METWRAEEAAWKPTPAWGDAALPSVTRHELIRRGWPEKVIKPALGEPDLTVPSGCGSRTHLYRMERVLAAEERGEPFSGPGFVQRYCLVCQKPLLVNRPGQRAKFCSPKHRVAYFRAKQK